MSMSMYISLLKRIPIVEKFGKADFKGELVWRANENTRRRVQFAFAPYCMILTEFTLWVLPKWELTSRVTELGPSMESTLATV